MDGNKHHTTEMVLLVQITYLYVLVMLLIISTLIKYLVYMVDVNSSYEKACSKK